MNSAGEHIQVQGKDFELYITRDQIRKKISDLAEELNRDYKNRDPVFVSILNGSFVFASDILRELNIPCRISFLKVKSYENMDSTGKIHSLIGLDEDLKNENVIILEDIVDSGLTMTFLLDYLNQRGPDSLEILSLFRKPTAMKNKIEVKYLGFDIPNDFIIGYGLDYNGYGRNLPEIYVHKTE
jgi:hypoxanthine phosphoribosyltransferase